MVMEHKNIIPINTLGIETGLFSQYRSNENDKTVMAQEPQEPWGVILGVSNSMKPGAHTKSYI
jgi:hypothetical protein